MLGNGCAWWIGAWSRVHGSGDSGPRSTLHRYSLVCAWDASELSEDDLRKALDFKTERSAKTYLPGVFLHCVLCSATSNLHCVFSPRSGDFFLHCVYFALGFLFALAFLALDFFCTAIFYTWFFTNVKFFDTFLSISTFSSSFFHLEFTFRNIFLIVPLKNFAACGTNSFYQARNYCITVTTYCEVNSNSKKQCKNIILKI